MNPDVDPLAPDVEKLIAAERRRTPWPADMRARLLMRLQASAASLSSAAGVAAASDGTSASRILAHPVRLALVTFVLGAGMGAGLHALLAPTEKGTSPATQTSSGAVPSPRPSLPAVDAQASPPPAQVAAPSRPEVVPVAVRPTRRTSEAPPLRPVASREPAPARQPTEDLDIEREQQLLEPARLALRRRDGQAALAAVEEHGTNYPEGYLAEEREALRVQALVTTGDQVLARERAAAFRQSYPASIYLATVEHAVASIR